MNFKFVFFGILLLCAIGAAAAMWFLDRKVLKKAFFNYLPAQLLRNNPSRSRRFVPGGVFSSKNRKKTNMHYPDLSPDDVLAGEKRAKKSNYYVHDTAAWPDLVKMKENRKKLNVQPAAFETEYIDYRSAHETEWSPKGFKDK